MDLCIDIGNTVTKMAFFDHEGQLVNVIYNPLPEQWENLPVERVAIIQTGHHPLLSPEYFKQRNIPVLVVSADIRLPFQNLYRTPQTLGADRIALAAGAVKFFKGNRLVIDAGTCVTYDFVNRKNQYLGGIIAPGLDMRYQAMHDYTARLPLLSPPPHKPSLIGRSTDECIHAGARLGWEFEIRAFMKVFEDRYPELKVILTGGNAEILYKSIKNEIFAFRKFLAFEGMHYLLTLNM